MAADAIAETNRGISGPKIVTYCNHFASAHNIRIPHAAYPFVARNKRTALLENLRQFPPEIQYELLLQLCNDRSLADNEPVRAARQFIVERYGYLAPVASRTPETVAARPAWLDPKNTLAEAMPAVPVPPKAALTPPAKPTRPYNIFLSYSHDDEDLMNLVRKHLVVYDRQALIRKWWDRKLTAGATLDESIRNELMDSDIILLFVSASFLASDYCYEVEMKQALAQHASGQSVVVPVILRSCQWRAAPMIGGLLALPEDARPITLWSDRDEAANNVAEGVMKIVADLQARGGSPRH